MIALSSYLIPQLVVIDTEICQRVEKSVAIDGILTSLCIAVEAFLSPASDSNPRYKANAVISCQLLLNNLDKLINNPDDTFIRKSIAVGSYYAGLSSTHTGIGYAHMIIHSMLEKNCDVHGVYYLKLLSIILRKTMSFYNERIAELSRELHLCSNSADDTQASETLIERFERICSQYSDYFVSQSVSRDEIKKMLEDIKKEGFIFELKKLPNSLFVEALEEISDNG